MLAMLAQPAPQAPRATVRMLQYVYEISLLLFLSLVAAPNKQNFGRPDTTMRFTLLGHVVSIGWLEVELRRTASLLQYVEVRGACREKQEPKYTELD